MLWHSSDVKQIAAKLVSTWQELQKAELRAAEAVAPAVNAKEAVPAKRKAEIADGTPALVAAEACSPLTCPPHRVSLVLFHRGEEEGQDNTNGSACSNINSSGGVIFACIEGSAIVQESGEKARREACRGLFDHVLGRAQCYEDEEGAGGHSGCTCQEAQVGPMDGRGEWSRPRADQIHRKGYLRR